MGKHGGKKATKKFKSKQGKGHAVKKGPKLGFKQKNKPQRGQDVVKASGVLHHSLPIAPISRRSMSQRCCAHVRASMSGRTLA